MVGHTCLYNNPFPLPLYPSPSQRIRLNNKVLISVNDKECNQICATLFAATKVRLYKKKEKATARYTLSLFISLFKMFSCASSDNTHVRA